MINNSRKSVIFFYNFSHSAGRPWPLPFYLRFYEQCFGFDSSVKWVHIYFWLLLHILQPRNVATLVDLTAKSLYSISKTKLNYRLPNRKRVWFWHEPFPCHRPIDKSFTVLLKTNNKSVEPDYKYLFPQLLENLNKT